MPVLAAVLALIITERTRHFELPPGDFSAALFNDSGSQLCVGSRRCVCVLTSDGTASHSMPMSAGSHLLAVSPLAGSFLEVDSEKDRLVARQYVTRKSRWQTVARSPTVNGFVMRGVLSGSRRRFVFETGSGVWSWEYGNRRPLRRLMKCTCLMNAPTITTTDMSRFYWGNDPRSMRAGIMSARDPALDLVRGAASTFLVLRDPNGSGLVSVAPSGATSCQWYKFVRSAANPVRWITSRGQVVMASMAVKSPWIVAGIWNIGDGQSWHANQVFIISLTSGKATRAVNLSTPTVSAVALNRNGLMAIVQDGLASIYSNMLPR